MKTSANVLVVTGVLAGLVSHQWSHGTELSHGDPFTPVGSLRVTPEVVQAGVQPEMTWAIEYPKTFPNLAALVPPGKIVTTNDQPNVFSVRVAGVSFNSGDADLPVALWVRTSNTGSWNLLFYGRESDVDAGQVLFQETVLEGTHIDFAARGQSESGAWLETRWTLAETSNISAVIDGDSLPSDSSAFTTGEVESFMTQFVDGNNQVDVGPRDVVHLFELGSDSPGTSAFDMQDIVVVSTMERSNHGHGNNEDGYDSSNPAEMFGVAGTDYDASADSSTESYDEAYIDDEKQFIKKKIITTTTTVTE